MNAEIESVLDFWFADAREAPARNAVWFLGNPTFDAEIRTRFGDLVEAARAGELDPWQETPRGALAWVILVDQFSRNLHRGTAAAFEADARALEVAKRAIERGWDRELPLVERVFFYLPFEHAENLHDQDRCVALLCGLESECDTNWKPLFSGYVGFGRHHQEIVARFGRFPHRNRVLGREDTDAERAFLEAGGSRFGQ